jgi:V8-like Glu-specific endopeptidase
MGAEVKTVKATKKADDIKKYWTPKKIKAAKPQPYKPTETVQKAEQTKSTASKDKGKNKGKSGQGTKKHNKSSSGATQTAVTAQSSAQPVANPQAYPWCCVGKLLFSMGGQDFEASASVFGDNVILTAAHCLYDVDEKQYADNVIFIPAYTDGDEPFGRWVYSSYSLPQNWVAGEGDAYDYATVELAKGGEDNESIGEEVGYLGYITQIAFDQTWTDIGYPAAISGGQKMIEEPGEYTRTQEENTIVGKVGTMADGASGGPWLAYYDMGWRINGVHSYGDDNFPGEVFSAYFGEEVADFLQATDN